MGAPPVRRVFHLTRQCPNSQRMWKQHLQINSRKGTFMTTTTESSSERASRMIIASRKHMHLRFRIPKSDAHSLVCLLGIAVNEVTDNLLVLERAKNAPEECHSIGDYVADIRTVSGHDILVDPEEVQVKIRDVNHSTAQIHVRYVAREMSSIGDFVRRVIAQFPHVEATWSAWDESDYSLEEKQYRNGEVWFRSLHNSSRCDCGEGEHVESDDGQTSSDCLTAASRASSSLEGNGSALSLTHPVGTPRDTRDEGESK